MKNKFLVLTLIFGIIAGVSLSITLTRSHNHSQKQNTVIQTKQLPTTESSNAPELPGIPTSITIPKINVHAAVESVGMDSLGRMDVPKTADDTAWYSPGYKPGMNGSAVIDGHLDRVTGAPAVFWNLKLLSAGDQIIITENNGQKYTFAVDHIMRYPYDSFPIKDVFGATHTPTLNLITCNGVWDQNTKNYSDRLVVYSKLLSQR